MSYRHTDGDGYVTEEVSTEVQTAEITGHIPYRHLSLSLDDGAVVNDDTDAETVTVEVLNGLDVARDGEGTATRLTESATAVVSVDGSDVSVTISDGVGSLDVTTSKAAGESITVEASTLDTGPAETDAAEIEVIA